MNKETFIEYIKRNKYNFYNYWENYNKDLEDKIDLLILYYQKELDIKIAELNAKIYVYENIIENSNFKAILSKAKQEK